MIHIIKEYACVKCGDVWYEDSKPHVDQWHVSYNLILCVALKTF